MSEAYVCGTQVLGTGSSLAPSFQYIQSDGVRGAGYLQAGLSVFAWNYKQWEGTIDWDVGSDGALAKAKTWAVTDRNRNETLRAKPGGYADMQITGKNSSLSVSTSAGSLVSASVGAMCFGDNGSVSASDPQAPESIAGPSTWCGNDGVIPYWKTSASIAGETGSCGAIDWSVSIENALVPILCCAGSNGSDGFYEPYDIYLGPTEASMDVTLLGNFGFSDFSNRKVTGTVNCGDSQGTSFTIVGIVTGITGGIQTGESIVGIGMSLKSVACEQAAVS